MGMTHSHDSAPNAGGSGCTDAGDGTCRDCGVAREIAKADPSLIYIQIDTTKAVS